MVLPLTFASFYSSQQPDDLGLVLRYKPVTDRISDVENVSASVTRCFVRDVEEKRRARFEFLLINNAKELYATLFLSS